VFMKLSISGAVAVQKVSWPAPRTSAGWSAWNRPHARTDRRPSFIREMFAYGEGPPPMSVESPRGRPSVPACLASLSAGYT
jgi:hypothetical protein